MDSMREPMPANNERLTVGYPGRDGAHSAAACDRLFLRRGARAPAELQRRRRGCSVRSGRIRVLPIESSLAGPAAETHDLPYDSPS